MRILFIFLLYFSFLEANTEDACYTVELLSEKKTPQKLQNLQEREFDSSCRVMPLNTSIKVRCACFETEQEAETLLEKLSQKYTRAKVARTYRYRFIDDPVARQKAKRDRKLYYKKSEKNSELRLMLQVFLYKGDLEQAYKVSKIAYKNNPSSYYWNKKMADICKWTGRERESIKYLKQLYAINQTQTKEEQLVSYALEGFDYDALEPLAKNRILRDPSKKNIDFLIYVYAKMGFPQKSIEFLQEQYRENPQKTFYLTQALQLSLEIGDMGLAKKYTQELERKRPYSKKSAILIARYYYLKYKLPKAYEATFFVQEESNTSRQTEIKYYELQSDLGWYMQDTQNAAAASKKLMDLNASRVVDYERISLIYKKSNPLLALNASHKAYKEKQLSYLFYAYANAAIENDAYETLNQEIIRIDSAGSKLSKESLYWMIKARVYGHYKEYSLQKEALMQALALSPDNYDIKLSILWYFMDLGDKKSLAMLLVDLSEDEMLQEEFYYPMTSAYFSLNDINSAAYYMQAILMYDLKIAHSIEFKFLQAYIYQAQNREGAYRSKLYEIKKQLKKDAKENPKLKNQSGYLVNYLSVSMQLMQADKFERKLQKAKKYLSKQKYDELNYTWAMQKSALQKGEHIYNTMQNRPLWIKFSHALSAQKHSEIETLLDKYLNELSIGNASYAAREDGQISLAQSLSFKALNLNDYSQNAYMQHRDLSSKRSDLLDVKLSHYNRDPLLQKYMQLNNKTYLQAAWYIHTGLNYYDNSSLDENVLVEVPSETVELKIGLEKIFNRGSFAAFMEYHNSMESYLAYVLKGEYQLSSDFRVRAELAHNKNTLESTQLLLGGKKDLLSLGLEYKLLNSLSINVLHEQNRYNSQDDVYLGSGYYNRIALAKQIRSGYPDLLVGTFADMGNYSETTRSRGVIDRLTVANFNALPANFYNIGVNLSYGMQNRNSYTRVWRPYFEISPYLNHENSKQTYTYSLNVGYGGKVWHQDHLAVGASYSNFVNGVGGTTLEFYLNYKFMYYHP